MNTRQKLQVATEALRELPHQTSANWNENYKEFIEAAKLHRLGFSEGLKLEFHLRVAEALLTLL